MLAVLFCGNAGCAKKLLPCCAGGTRNRLHLLGNPASGNGNLREAEN